MEIASLVISIIALVVALMAIPTILQMFFGRPHLNFEADDFTGPEGKILVIAIKNLAVKSRLLRLMGVERETGDVNAFFDIQELGTGKIIARAVTGLMQTTHLREIGLQARSAPGFTVGLTIISSRNGQAAVVDGRQELPPTPLSNGHYIAHIAVVRGQNTYRIDQSFRVGNADHETVWYERNVVGIRQ